MGAKTAIEWTDRTCTPIRARNRKTGKVGWHCEHSTTGCKFCYAEGINKRLGTGLPFKPAHLQTHGIELFLDEKMLTQPLRWKQPSMIFMCSMTDMFAGFVPDEWIDQIFAVMALTPHHTYQVLTKRSARMHSYANDPETPRRISAACNRLSGVKFGTARFAEMATPEIVARHWPFPNVWLGVSAERQEEANERIPDLLLTPAAIRFISAEPLLGPIDLTRIIRETDRQAYIDNALDGFVSNGFGGSYHAKLDWVIVGGESGSQARPMHPTWAWSLLDQCKAAGVQFLFKQWGSFAPVGWVHTDSKGSLVRPDGRICASRSELAPSDNFEMIRVGKKKAGRLLHGVEHNGFPAVLQEAA